MEESWRDDEIEVCKILLELPQLIYESERPFIWGGKGRRSAIADSEVSCSPVVKEALVAPPTKETAVAGSSRVEAASPATPLSFPPSEADDNLKRKKKVPKVPKQRKRDELLEIIDGLTKRGNLLRGEIQNVRNYYDKLRAKNLKLKAKKQELEQRKSLNLARELAEATFKTSILEPQLHLHQQPPPPLMMDQTAHRSENGENHEHPYARFPPLLACSAQLGIPNLNISAQVFDLQMGNMQMSVAKAAAQARQKRIQINRAKNPIVAGKTRSTNR